MKNYGYNTISIDSLTKINGGKNYGNGVSCNKKGCSVDWGTATTNIINNSAMNLLTGGAAGWH